MTRSLRSIAPCAIVLAGLLLLSACGKHEPAAPASPPATAGTVPATALPAPATTSATTIPAAGSTAVAAAPASAVTTPAAPVPAPLSIAKLTLGNSVNADHQVTRASDSFATSNKTIYASVATEGSSGGATLNARWSYLEGQGQLVSSISQSIATDGPATTTFKVQNPDLWPAGKYQVEISLDGKPVTRQAFEIKKG